MLTTDGTWRNALSASGWRSFAITSTAVVLALGIFVVARRVTGAVTSQAPLMPLFLTAAILAAWACLMRFIVSGRQATLSRLWLPLVAILLFAIGLSYPGTRVFDWLVWFAACAVHLSGPRWLAIIGRRIPARARKRRGQRLIQDFKRYRGAEGRELVRGTLAAEFPPGGRTETLWVGFCPPFEFLPQVTAHPVGNVSASVKVAQVLHNGAQLELRLPHPSGCQQVANIEFVAAESDPR